MLINSKIRFRGLSSKQLAELSHKSKCLHPQKNIFNCYTSKAEEHIIALLISLIHYLFFCIAWEEASKSF